MAGIPKVKITFDADFDDLKRGVKGATDEVQSFGSRVGDFGKKAAAAFAIAGAAAAAYAGKLLIDGVKSAIADEAAQVKLATSLQNVTGATAAQVAAVEAQILKTELLTGLTDEQLRPSLDRLLRATKDVSEAQRLQALAIDVAAGSGKSLEAVSNALGKAYEGSTTALGKLGVGLSAAQLKTMSMEEVTASLAKTFEGQASKQAETFAGKMSRLKVAFDEGKETVGAFVLDAITPLISTLVKDVIPKIAEVASTIKTNLQPTFEALSAFFTTVLIPAFQLFWGFIQDVVIPLIVGIFKPALDGLFSAFGKISEAIVNNKDKLLPLFELFKDIAGFVAKVLAPIFGTTLRVAFEVIGSVISGLITGFSAIAGSVMSVVNAIKSLISIVANNPIVKGVAGLVSNAFGGFRAGGGSVMSGTPYVVGERGAELFVPNSSGTIVPNSGIGGGTTINLVVNGAIDAEGTARTIIDVLNRSNARGTLGAARLNFA